ncbi:hypothetical protein LLH00_04010 [bacterium]|nr:hypothetical protein [bacterium]
MAIFRRLVLGAIVLTGLGLAPTYLLADQHSLIQRFQLGANWKASPELTLRGLVQARFRSALGDYYFFLSDLGVEYRTSRLESFRLPVYYRFQDKESGPAWKAKHYLMLDPTLRLARCGPWELDLRQRFQLDAAGGFELVYLRPLLRLSYAFRAGGTPCRAWVYYDYYLTVQRSLRRAWADPSDFSTGVSLTLNPSSDLLLYYMIYSSRSRNVKDWGRIHQICSALSFKF